MGKYAALEQDIFSVFGDSAWGSQEIETYPSNFAAKAAGEEFIRVSIVPSGVGVNISSVSGVLMIDVFISAGNGPARASFIADKLDQFLVGKLLSSGSGKATQFFGSALSHYGLDRDNPALHRSSYTIPFSYYGAN